MVLRNLVRNGRRSLVGVFASALASSLLVTGLVARKAVVELVDFQYKKVLRSDIDLVFRDQQGREALLEAKRLPGVDHAEPTLEIGCIFRNGVYEKRAGISGRRPRGAGSRVPRDIEGNPVSDPPRRARPRPVAGETGSTSGRGRRSSSNRRLAGATRGGCRSSASATATSV